MYGQSKLMIRRNYSMAYSARNVKVFVDGVNRGVSSCNGFVMVDLRKGFHAVEVKMGRKTIGSACVESDGETNVTLRFKVSNDGRAVFDAPVIDNLHREHIDNVAPPVALPVASPANAPVSRPVNSPAVQRPTQTTYHTTVYTSSAPKSSGGVGCLIFLMIVLIIVIILWLLSSMTFTFVFDIIPIY